MKPKIYVVGFGPGERPYMTQQAVDAMTQADLVVGYTTYVRLLEKQFPELQYYATPMRKETDRCRAAVEAALTGKTVALVSSGDSGIYGMAGVLLEIAAEMQADVEVTAVAGVTAASAAAAVLGAPLMHDFAVISLSDCMTPLEQIYRRVALAAEADFVICLYNPKSRSRTAYLAEAAKLIQQHRKPETPVGIVRNAGREGERAWITTLEKLPEEDQLLIRLRFYGGKTQSETAKLLHTTQVQISRRERKLLKLMRAKLLEE